MADKVVSLEFKVKTDQAVVEIDKVTESVNEATLATKKYEKELADIKKQADGGGFKELSNSIKKYQELALQAGETSPIGRQALAEAGELKDRLMDLKATIKTAGQDGLELQASLQLGGGIVAGFGAVQGVMALVGSESEDLQKTLVKLQAVQATLASVEEIRSVLEKESALRITAVTIAEKGRAAATALATVVTNAGIMSLRAFKIALAATGIGAIVVVLIAAAEAMGLFGDSADDTAKQIDKLNASTEKQSELIKKVNQDLDERTQRDVIRAKIAGKTEADILQIEKDAQKEKIKNLLKYSQEADAAYDKIKGIKEASTEQIEDSKKRSEEAYANLQKAQTERNLKSLEKDLELANKTREAAKAAEEKRKADLKTAADARRAKEKEWQAELQADKDKLAKDEKEASKKKFADDQQLMLARSELFAADLAAAKASSDSKKALDKEEFETKIRLAMQGANLINDLMQLTANKSKANAERAFKINKAYQLAVAINDGYKAVLSTYAETKGGPILKGIAAGLAGAFAGVQIAKISQSKFDSSKFETSNAPSGDIPNVREMQTGAPTLPGSQSTMLREQVTTVKAIVVESDITSTQKRVNSIKENATI